MITREFKCNIMSKLSHPPLEWVLYEMTEVKNSTYIDTALIVKLASNCFSHLGDMH